jgi:cytoskeletal protein RodZ
MESVGQKLRAIRLQQGLALEDISAKTRISRRNLQAIENDDLSPIGSAFFYKSFVRQFAQQLKVDYSELAAAVESLTSTLPEPLMPGQTAAWVPVTGVPSLRLNRPKRLRWLYSFTSLIGMLVACSTVYAMWQNSRSSLQVKISGFVSSLMDRSTRQPSLSTMHGVSPTPEPVREPAEAASPTAPDRAFRVELSAIERTWLSIAADGQETFTGVLETAQTKVLEGHETARIRTANAGGLSVVFNGRAIGSLGPRGQVRTVVFTKTGYQTLEPSATPAAHLSFTPFIPNGE